MSIVGHAAIAALIPHQGTMCLLDRVLDWNEAVIECSALSHRDPNHPLRAGDHLPSLVAIEYGAQAMAVHGALLARAAGGRARPGFLVAVRDVTLHRETLDEAAAPLQVRAERLLGDAGGLLYSFEVRAAGETIATGRAMVTLDAVGAEEGR